MSTCVTLAYVALELREAREPDGLGGSFALGGLRLGTHDLDSALEDVVPLPLGQAGYLSEVALHALQPRQDLQEQLVKSISVVHITVDSSEDTLVLRCHESFRQGYHVF